MSGARPVMVLGCTSSAGKSLVATALCRWFARQGLRVAPFKAQNMSNNARVVDGGEIGVAQWLQSLAAGTEPDVRTNPVLVKPEADDRSHVIVLGRPRPDLTVMPWLDRQPHLWDAMRDAYDSLADDVDLVVLEGAGSPAEINLPDLVNNRMLRHADAAALLVADIDRGGAFAHLVGTWTLVPDSTRERLRAFVLNKFRGDVSLLAPAPEHVAERTGMAAAGVLPMLDHELPDEEGATRRAAPPPDASVLAIVRAPYASNLDEFHAVAHAASVVWATTPGEVAAADVVVLPGSRHVLHDVEWMRRRGLDAAIRAAAGAGRRVIGVCGGAMALGRTVHDPDGVEGGGSPGAPGLGLLDLTTTYEREKITRRTTVRLDALPPAFHGLDGCTADGYEIRHGRIDAGATCRTADANVFAAGTVLATTVHGLLEDAGVVARLLGHRPPDVLAATFDRLADAVDEHLDTAVLRAMAGI